MPSRFVPFSDLGTRLAAVALLLASMAAPLVRPAAAKPAAPVPDPAWQALLQSGDLTALEAACAKALAVADGPRLRQLQQRLLSVHPAPQPLAVVLANAQALLSCGAPDGALRVLARVSPAPGPERRQWLLLQWRAAQAGLHHQLAAEALERLADGNLASLAAVDLPVAERPDGSAVLRSALDLLADHFESLAEPQRAAAALLAGAVTGPGAAERLARAVPLLQDLPVAEQERLLELALEQAAAAGSWGLAAQILDQQLALPGSSPQALARAAERRLRLSAGIDDAYGEWQLRRRDPHAASPRQAELEQRLRSPRAAGGHAASPTPEPQP